MGMYTEIVVKFDFNKSSLSKIENNVLDYLFNPNSEFEDTLTNLPDHPFFRTERWSSIGCGSSFHHHPEAVHSWYVSSRDNIYVFNRSDLKNYDDEIKNFFDWFNTLNCMFSGDFIGYSLYEEDDIPTIWRKD